MPNLNYTKGSEVKVYDLITGELKETKPAYTEKELKVIINKGIAHKNSMAELIKSNPELLAKYHANRTKYEEDYDAMYSLNERGKHESDRG